MTPMTTTTTTTMKTGSEDAGRDDVALIEQLALRLCHDLAGLCGTLVGVLELAVEDPGSLAEALPLAHEMASALTARLRLLRTAWGAPGEALDSAGLTQLSQGLPGGPRIKLDLSGMDAAQSLSPALARVVLNALLLGTEALPGGGTLTLESGEDGLALGIAGRRPAWPDSLVPLLREPGGAGTMLRECGPRRLQTPLLILLAQAAGIGLRLAPSGLAPSGLGPSGLEPPAGAQTAATLHILTGGKLTSGPAAPADPLA